MSAFVATNTAGQTRPLAVAKFVYRTASRAAVCSRSTNAIPLAAAIRRRVLVRRQSVRRLTAAAVTAAAVTAAAGSGGSGGEKPSPLQALGRFLSANFIPVGLVFAICIG